MSIFNVNHHGYKNVLGTEFRVFINLIVNEDESMSYKIMQYDMCVKHMEMPDNSFVSLANTDFVGIARIQGYLYDNSGIKPIAISNGLYTSVLMDVIAYYRSQGILAMTKAKSQTDLIYLFKNPHVNEDSLITKLVSNGIGFKEFQRLLGTNQLISEKPLSLKAVVIDLEKYFKANGISLSDPSDGKAISKLQPQLNIQGELQKQYSMGFRIIDHPVILTSKGNLNFNLGEFNNLCKFYGIDSSDVDILLPLSTVKVTDELYLTDGKSEVFDISKQVRFVSYKTERVQSYARLSTVGCVTHGSYASVLCHLVKYKTHASKVCDLLSRTIEGRLDSFVNLIKAGSGNDMLGSALFAAFPIWSEDKWHLIRNTESINNLYMQVASAHQKHVRKVRVKGGFNRRASHNLDIEKCNVGNNTGAYIVDIRKGVINIPQKLWVDLGLGDYDGDDCVIYPIIVDKEKNLKIYLIGRNPMSGNTLFVGIQKGKGTVQDIPEWAQPFVKFHRKITVPEAPKKDKTEVGESFKEQVQHYINTVFSASINGPALGTVTNRLYKTRLEQIVSGNVPSAQEIVENAHTLENEVVKAIKSTLSVELTPLQLARIAKIKFGMYLNKENKIDSNGYFKQLKFAADVVDGYASDKLGEIFPNPELGSVATELWDLCSKYNYQCSYADYMKNIVKIANKHSEQFSSILPISAATRGYNPSEWVAEAPEDVVIAGDVCRFILGDAKHYKLPVIDNRMVDRVNDLYSIFTAYKQPKDELYDSVCNAIFKMMEDVKRDNLKGDDLVKYKVNCALSILRMFMGVKHAKLDAIMEGYRKGATIHMGVRDIMDMNMRSFAYACIHAYIKAYIVHLYPNENARTSAMFQTGRKLFGIYKGKVRSNRLFWLYASTFSKEQIMLLSNLWMDAQERKYRLDTKEVVRPVSVDDMNQVIGQGINRQDSVSEVVSDDIDFVFGFDSVSVDDICDGYDMEFEDIDDDDLLDCY